MTFKSSEQCEGGNGLIKASLVEGLKPNKSDGGHKPWTLEQISAIDDMPDILRKGVMLYLYTGQRGSDVVRLGWTDVDGNGFPIRQQKTKVNVWCPIVPELEAEMKTWERRPGPFLLTESGRRFTRKAFAQVFADYGNQTPVLSKTTLHGLRCTAVIRLRMEGLSTGQIGDITGMSLQTIERYCRFADKKRSGQAALIQLKRTSAERDCKTVENCKTSAQ